MTYKKLIAEAREYIDEDGYAWTSWWDRKQVAPVLERLVDALEEMDDTYRDTMERFHWDED